MPNHTLCCTFKNSFSLDSLNLCSTYTLNFILSSHKSCALFMGFSFHFMFFLCKNKLYVYMKTRVAENHIKFVDDKWICLCLVTPSNQLYNWILVIVVMPNQPKTSKPSLKIIKLLRKKKEERRRNTIE